MSEQSSSSWSDRLLGGFRKTSDRLSENIAPVSQTRGNTRLDDATLDEIEDALIMSDLGPEAAGRVREALREQRFGAEITERQLREAVAEEIAAILRPVALTDDEGTGEVRLGENVDPKGEAARGDVARLLADAAESPEWVGKVLHMETVAS